MLRKGTKENFIRILQDVLVLCENALKKDVDVLISVLQESQDAVISVGKGLEKSVESPMEIISKMESLCEAFYVLSLNMENREAYGNQIKELLTEIIEMVSDLPVSYQVVFFPYKVEMWDSLESVWLACKDDPAMECKVVPIPYYNFDVERNLWKFHYEIDHFPDYVPVVHYTDYDISECADVAFVHNPYDEYNHVTHVHSDYYSYNLKKYVKTLFYVPYYVTSGFIAENHKSLSVYAYADYIVVQSEAFKEGLKESGYAHKALVMGSPKLDRVIRLSGSRDDIPETWKSILQGKKSIMLNTSLHQFLIDGELYLQKLLHVFNVMKQKERIVLIWRPHPLLYSTIESMRPELLPMYQQLLRKFKEEEIGILDTTPDIANIIAAADGYLGEMSSSVVNLFEAVGKPVFILNNLILDNFDTEQQRALLLYGCNKVNEDYYCTVGETSDILVVKDNKWQCMMQETLLSKEARWKPVLANGISVGNALYFAPFLSEKFYSYDIGKHQLNVLSDLNTNKIWNYQGVVKYKNKIFYIPNITRYILEYDITQGTWLEHYSSIVFMKSGVIEQKFETGTSYYVSEQYIWMSSLNSNQVLAFDMEHAEYRIYEVGDKDARYGAIAVNEERLYVSDADTGVIHEWNYELAKCERSYKMPMQYRVHKNIRGVRVAHSKLWLIDGCLYAIPNTSNMLIKVEIDTGMVSEFAKELWLDVLEPTNNYHPEKNMVVNFSQLVDEHVLLIQKRRDASLLQIDTCSGQYEIHRPMLRDEELERIFEKEDGFEKANTNGEFARREGKYFSLDGFLDDLEWGKLTYALGRQNAEMQGMAANLDGTCGEKVYDFIKRGCKKLP